MMQEDLTLEQFFLCLFLVFLSIFTVGIHPSWPDYLDKAKEKRIRRNANYGYKSTQTKE